MPLKKQDELFIQAAIKRGVLTKAQAEECAASQESMAAMGIEKNLAQIAQDKGFLDRQRAMSVMRAIQRKSVRAEIGGYEILGMLGKGGMGSVYKARQRSMNRVVALKVLPASLAMDAKCRARFLLEVKAVAKLNHPNIVQAIDTGEVDGMHFFVMEYVDGRSVDHMLKHEGIIDEQRAVRIALQIAKALQYAEPFAIVHRDIKPSNILVTKGGVAKLSDFGLAKQAAEMDQSLTQSGTAVGTPYYMAPEQARGEADIDSRADIYALGATLYHMVVGEVPFQGVSAAAILTKQFMTDLVPPIRRNPALSVHLSCIIEKMMAKDKNKRYQNAGELIADFDKFLRDEPPQAAIELGKAKGLDLSGLSDDALEPILDDEPEEDRKFRGPMDSGELSQALSDLAEDEAAEDDAPKQSIADELRLMQAARRVSVPSPLRPSNGDEPSDKKTKTTVVSSRPPGAAVPGMIHVPGGKFLMGSDKGRGNESPRHEVELAPFLIDRTEVTNADYLQFIRATQRKPPLYWKDGTFPRGKEKHPVVCVSWFDAAAYAEWAGKRLPSEPEWEMAARGTDGREFPWGNDFDANRCNTIVRLAGRPFRRSLERNQWLRAWELTPEGQAILTSGGNTTPVDAFPAGASPYGVLDMAGNVLEWTADWYQAYPGSTASGSNFGTRYRIVRGGSWRSTERSARCAARNFNHPRLAFNFLGFRCAKDA